MVASHHREEPLRVRPATLLDVLDPGAIHSERHIMLGLARHGAGVAANALVLVDDESVLHRYVVTLAKAIGDILSRWTHAAYLSGEHRLEWGYRPASSYATQRVASPAARIEPANP